jgi:serine/threonine protein kinase
MLLSNIDAMHPPHHPASFSLSLSPHTPSPRSLGQEFCTGGDLRAAMDNHPQMVKAKAADFMHQIADAIDYLHRQKVVHRDIKAENCLLVSKGRRQR